MDSESGYHIGKLRRKINDMDLNEVNSQTKTPYNRNRQGKPISRSGEENFNFDELIPDNYSVKANSVQTSYQYNKKKHNCNSHNNDNENYPDSEMSDNSNLICPYCINSILADEKHKREDLDKNWQSNGLLEDRTKNYEQDLINKKRQQREKLTKDAIENLAKLNQNLSNKDKLIQMNESSRNPLDMRTDYKYQKFQDEYARKQKLINDNLDKFYPNYNDRPEIKSYYDNYVYNPVDNNKIPNVNNYGEYVPMENNKKAYYKDLEDQIKYKNDLKKKEKEEEQRREQRQFMNLQEQMKKEEQEKFMKEQKQKEDLMRANMELINQKNKMKLKELEEKLKYKEACDREEEAYKRELLDKELQKAKMKNELYNDKLNNEKYLQKMKQQELEKENERRAKLINNADNMRDIRDMRDKRHADNMNNMDDKGMMNKGDMRNMNNMGDMRNEGLADNNINAHGFKPCKERMGRCCRCHKIYPRRILTINRYFYKDNRKQ